MVRLIRDAVLAAIADEAARFAGGKDRPRVIDVGCGGQPFRNALESAGFEYHSLDALQNAKGSVEFVGAIDATLPDALRRTAPFDLVLCTEVLEHVADWRPAFANVACLTATGGRVILTCPHLYELHEEPCDFFRSTPYAIRHWAEAAGLRVLRCEKLGTSWDALGTVLASFRIRPGDGSVRSRLTAYWTRKITKGLSRRLASGWIQRSARAEGPLYLSNFAILERP